MDGTRPFDLEHTEWNGEGERCEAYWPDFGPDKETTVRCELRAGHSSSHWAQLSSV